MQRIDYFNLYWQHLNTLNAELKETVIDLGMGMPDPTVFKTPKVLLEKLHEAIDKGDYSLYCQPEGNINLLNEILCYENKCIDKKNAYGLGNILLTPGAIAAYPLLVDSIIEKDDEILVINPSYFSLAGLSELKTRIKEVNAPQFNISKDLIEKNKTEKTKIVFLCNPDNPTGLFTPSKELQAIIELAKSSNVIVIIDESCRNYIFEPEKSKQPENIVNSNVIRIKSFSKEQNLSAYRLGYMLADESIVKKLKYKIPVIYGNPPIMADRALVTEFKIKNGNIENKAYHNTVKRNFETMKQNREFAYNKLQQSDAIEEAILPQACYYIFAKCKYSKGSLKLFEELLYKQFVNVCPGVLFGMPENKAWIRICFARKQETLEEALNRILNFLK